MMMMMTLQQQQHRIYTHVQFTDHETNIYFMRINQNADSESVARDWQRMSCPANRRSGETLLTPPPLVEYRLWGGAPTANAMW